jgi:oligopeptide/dipeptide ABC transporter ATP-binding protein
MNAVLSISGISVRVANNNGPLELLSDVSLAIDDGEIVALVGESGSGKSVTALSILGLLPATASVSGSIKFRDTELLGMATRPLNKVRGRRIAMIFQEPMSSLNPAFTIGAQLQAPIRRHLGVSKREAVNSSIELLEMVGISDAKRRLNDYPHTFSGGMRQRVMIAMALSCGPDLLIADEPTTALDATVQAQILALLRDLRDRTGMAILFLTHDLGAVASIADRVDVMYAGQIVEAADADSLFDRPLHPYSAGLLASVARLDVDRPLTTIPGSVPSPGAVLAGCRFRPRCTYAELRCTVGPVDLSKESSRTVRCVRHDELKLSGANDGAA